MLDQYIISKLSTPFEYGKNDCVIFAIGWLEILNGKKYLPEKLWDSEQSAKVEILKNGSILAAVDREFDRIDINTAMDGDIGMRNGLLHIFVGSKIVAASKDGIIFFDRKLAEIAWTGAKNGRGT